MSHTWKIVAAVILCLTTKQAFAAPVTISEADSETAKILSAYKTGHLTESIALAQNLVKQSPKNSLAHATLSFLAWQQGNALLAIEEGQQSIATGPNNLQAVLNLAEMEESLSDYKDAIEYYKEASKLAPQNWAPQLGVARCLLKGSQKDEGLASLKNMGDENKSDSDWQIQIADIYLQAGESKLAVDAANRALGSAKNSEQAANASNLLMLALLRNDDNEKARALEQDVFAKYHPNNYELYVRAASALLKPTELEPAKRLFDSAVENLKSEDEADGFYRLGRIFQEKSSIVKDDSNKSTEWLNLAEAAYNKAISFDPMPARYHLSLAGIAGRQGKIKEMENELNKAKSVETLDTVAPFLLDLAQQANPSLKTGEAIPCQLSKIQFKVSGLSCNCHVTKVETAFGKINGIAACTILRDDSHDGVILIDETKTKADEAFAQCIKAFEGAPELKTNSKLGFEFISRKELSGTDEVVRIAQNSRYGGVLEFYNQFKSVNPILPARIKDEQTISSKQK